jgi:hypothetical protein
MTLDDVIWLVVEVFSLVTGYGLLQLGIGVVVVNHDASIRLPVPKHVGVASLTILTLEVNFEACAGRSKSV